MPRPAFTIATDAATDLLEKVSSPGSRAGSAVERVGRMLENGVDVGAIARQMTANSASGERYSIAMVRAYGKLFEDAKTRSPITARQARALIQDQRHFGGATSLQPA